MLETVCWVKANPLQFENMLFMNPVRCKNGEEVLAHLKSFVIALFLVSLLRVGDANTEMGEFYLGPKAREVGCQYEITRGKMISVIIIGNVDKVMSSMA